MAGLFILPENTTCLDYSQNFDADKGLVESAALTYNFRDFLNTIQRFSVNRKGFSFSFQDLDRLKAQQSATITGIKIYIGEERVELTPGVFVYDLKVIAVAAEDNQLGSVAVNDYLVPKSTDPLPIIEPLVLEGRPCPEECGNGNMLNGE